MPGAGVYTFPSRDLDDCLNYLRRARNRLRSRSMTREGFAQAIGQSSRGGGFGKLVGAMTAYGLVRTGRGEIATTELGEQVLFGDPDEQKAGREMSIRTVRLFDQILKKYGTNPSEEQLRVFLREKANVDLSDATAVATQVGKLLRRNSADIRSNDRTPEPESRTASRKSMGELVARLETADYGILNIRDEISMDLAMNLLAQVKKSRGWATRAATGEASSPQRPFENPPERQTGKTKPNGVNSQSKSGPQPGTPRRSPDRAQ